MEVCAWYRKHGNAYLGDWNQLQALATMTKGIAACNSMLVKNLRSKAIVWHRYPIVSIDFHEHAMTDMMALRQLYAWFLSFRCEEALPRDGSIGIGNARELRRWVTTRKGVTKFLEELCRRGGNSMDGFVLVIIISRWNQTHIGSAP